MSGPVIGRRQVRLTVHPGLGKTATTTIQSVLRDSARTGSGLWYGGIRSHAYDHPFMVAFEELLREPLDRHTWRARVPLEERIERLAEAVAAGLRASPSGAGVLSNEAILAHVGDDVGWRGPSVARRGGGPGWRIALVRLERLAAVLARVSALLAKDGIDLDVAGLLTVRRQGSLLASSWAWNHEHYRRIGIRDEMGLRRSVARDAFPRLRFSRVVAAIEQSGIAPVTVLPLEALQSAPNEFWSALSRTVGTTLSPDGPPERANRRRAEGGSWTVRTVVNPRRARIGTSATFDRVTAPLPTAVRARLESRLQARSGDGPQIVVSDTFLSDIDAAYADDLPLLTPSCPFALPTLGYATVADPPPGTRRAVP